MNRKIDNSDWYNEDFGKRISQCLEHIGGLTAAAKIVGYKYESVAKWRDGLAKIPLHAVQSLAGAANTRLEWLATGKGPEREGDETGASIITIPLYDATLAAGAGSFNENAQIIHQIPFRKEFIQNIIGRKSTKDLAILTVQGDSMEPTIHNSDIVLIDEQSKNISDGIFCFLQDSLARIKRLHKMASGDIKIISDNKTYQAETIKPSEIEPFHIIGRVCWIGHQT